MEDIPSPEEVRHVENFRHMFGVRSVSDPFCEPNGRLTPGCKNEIREMMENEREKVPFTETQRQIMEKMSEKQEKRQQITDGKLEALTLAHNTFKAEIKADLAANRRFMTLLILGAQALSPILVFVLMKLFT